MSQEEIFQEDKPEEKMEEVAEEELNDLKIVVKEARRKSKVDIDKLIASELAIAMISPQPLQKIRHTLEAFKLVPKDRRVLCHVTEEEIELYERLYEVCISLMNTVEVPPRYGEVGWSFATEVAYEYFFWIKQIRLFEGIDKKLMEALKNGDEEARKEYCRKLAEYMANRCPLQIIKSFESDFIAYAMPIISELMAKILLVISDEAWSEAFKSLKKTE